MSNTWCTCSPQRDGRSTTAGSVLLLLGARAEVGLVRQAGTWRILKASARLMTHLRPSVATYSLAPSRMASAPAGVQQGQQGHVRHASIPWTRCTCPCLPGQRFAPWANRATSVDVGLLAAIPRFSQKARHGATGEAIRTATPGMMYLALYAGSYPRQMGSDAAACASSARSGIRVWRGFMVRRELFARKPSP